MNGIDPNSHVLIAHSLKFWQIAAMKDEAISRNPDVLGGTPVFAGTRVPVRNLVDCLEGGYSIDQFLEDFPTVRREQAIAVLEEASARLELATPA